MDKANDAKNQTSDATETSNWSSTLKAKSAVDFKQETFPQGCQFSPDGLCVLTAASNRLYLYNTPHNNSMVSSSPKQEEWKSCLTMETGDSVRSYDWYPHMNSNSPETCCFVSCSRDQPTHLWDAYIGSIRATYRAYNALDEVESPSVVAFSPDGQRIITGGFRTDRMLHIFDLSRPGRDSTILKLGKTRRSKDGQKGLASAIAIRGQDNLLAVGTYSPGSIYLYDARAQHTQQEVAIIQLSGTCIVGHGKSHGRKRKHFVVEATSAAATAATTSDEEEDVLNFSAAKVKWFQTRARGGVTQLEFSQCGNVLYSASRRSNALLGWDLRKLSTHAFCPGVSTFATDNDTNQRLEFTLHSSHVYVGGRDGRVCIYDESSQGLVGTLDTQKVQGGGCVGGAANGVSLSDSTGRTLLAVACGSRKFPTENDWDCEDPYSSSTCQEGGSLGLHEVRNNREDPTN
jgi:WD40 repeat protein